ncbi:hypothetical protein CF336_g2578 [Tilletia laevis]|nr:hypothetical protein CF336_g2578 [Tilletia laevis]
MDDTLYCNWLKCRKPLHIHVSCANELFGANKACPACEANLDRPDDVVISSLNPSTDYRTSVLAGLAPSITMEIATRSISFWTYQHEHGVYVLHKPRPSITSNNANQRAYYDVAANEMSLLHEKIADLVTEKRKTKDLQDALRNATKDYDRLKAQLDRSMRKQMLSAGSTGDALSAAAQRPEGLAQRSALNQSLANQPRATIGGTQKPASFWQAQSSGQTTDHAVQSTPSRLANNGAGPGPQMNYTPNHGANHGRFMAGGSASGAGGAGFGDHGDRAAPQLFGHESGSDMRQHGMNAAGVRGMNAQAAGAGLSGHNNSHNVNLSRQGGGSGNAASPMVASNWAQPRPISQNLVRPVPTNGVRLSSSSEGLVMHQGMSMSRAHMSGSGSTDPLQTPRGPSPVGNFLRSAGLRSGRGGHQGGGTPYRSIR